VAALLLGGAGIAVGIGWFLWRVPVPPELDLAGADPAIVRAIDEARAEVHASPRSAAAWGRLGMLLRAHDFGMEANACFAQAERFDGTDPRWPYLQGLTLALSDRDAAIPLLESAAQRSSTTTAPRLRLAEVLLLQGRQEDARRHFQKVVASDPANPRAQLGLARLAQRRDEGNVALIHVTHAVSSPLTRKSALTLRAEIRQQLGMPDQAGEDLRQAAKEPDDPPWPDPFVEEVERLRVGVQARLNLADRLLQQGRGPEAIALLEETAQSAPESDGVYLVLGQTWLRLGNPAQAQKALERAVAQTPGAAEAHFQLGNALFLQDQPGPAAERFRAAIRLNPAHVLAHYNLAHSLLKGGDRPGAIAAFRAALRYRPNYADAHINLGDLLAQEGKNVEALAHLEEAVRLAPADARARKLLAELRSRLK
jgi:tetratricopeptide (TPR) repeat protein